MTDHVLGAAELTAWRQWLYERLPRPRARRCAAGAARRILVLHKGANATLDYYLRARLAASGLPYELRCIDSDRLGDVEPDGTFVIVCRYVRARQVAWLRRHRARLAGVAYFLDDDIAALLSCAETDLDYRAYLFRFACLPLPFLSPLLSHVWASTPVLGRSFGQDRRGPEVLPPSPRLEDHLPFEEARREGRLKIVYHATNVHSLEHRFLIPVVEEFLRLRPGARFEVLAKGSNRGLWQRARIPAAQLTILPPMGWEDYHAHSRRTGADIALVPLIEGLANESRAGTKRIDCCRMGAASVMSDAAAYRPGRAAGEMLIRNDPAIWLAAMLRLADDASARSAARMAVREAVRAMTTRANLRLPGVVGAGEASGDVFAAAPAREDHSEREGAR